MRVRSGILLVDDSLERDAPPKWVGTAESDCESGEATEGAQVNLFSLPYEGPGLQEDRQDAGMLSILQDSLLRLEEEINKLPGYRESWVFWVVSRGY